MDCDGIDDAFLFYKYSAYTKTAAGYQNNHQINFSISGFIFSMSDTWHIISVLYTEQRYML